MSLCIRPYLRLRGGALENALLIQIIKAMQAQKALSNEQIAHYLPWTPTFPAAFLQAGLSCEQLREVLNASVAGGEQARNDTRQRPNALCPVAEVTKGIVNGLYSIDGLALNC
ncbi:Uncharacterised protein [Salmonella enterica subsp. enterica]|nr:Uncharacterised protein [Salmonella enterica subsp. enterica]